MSKPLLEACVGSYASARIATGCGADRLEVCGHLALGGVTVSQALFRQIRRDCDVTLHVLIRPRFGDFLYDGDEMAEMEEEIRALCALGADGVVIGALTPQGDLDREKMARLIEAAGGRPVTLHRAFDMTRDPAQALEDAVALGCGTILTSGQAADVTAGRDCLRDLHRQAAGRVTIMAGCGVKSANIPALHAHTGITAFHASARRTLESGMVYRKAGVSMGLPSLSEYELWQTDPAECAACVRAVHALA